MTPTALAVRKRPEHAPMELPELHQSALACDALLTRNWRRPAMYLPVLVVVPELRVVHV